MTQTNDKIEKAKLTCGIVMPISGIDGCTESHWREVLEILEESIEDAEYVPNLVSNADEVGIIHKTIIKNLYDNPIIVADVSGKNPNVMFELGIRLAFDKPTIIVKDDKTSYSFDTSSIEHLEYPRDLRFSKINEFKTKLTDKIAKTYQKSIDDVNYTTFLKHFGEFKVAKLEKKEVSGQEFMLEELKNINTALRRLDQSSFVRHKLEDCEIVSQIMIELNSTEKTKIDEYLRTLSKDFPDFRISPGDFPNIIIAVEPGTSIKETIEKINSLLPASNVREIRRRRRKPFGSIL